MKRKFKRILDISDSGSSNSSDSPLSSSDSRLSIGGNGGGGNGGGGNGTGGSGGLSPGFRTRARNSALQSKTDDTDEPEQERELKRLCNDLVTQWVKSQEVRCKTSVELSTL